MQEPNNAAILWDLDGVINIPDFENASTNIRIPLANYFSVVLNILEDNGVHSYLASQRNTYLDGDEKQLREDVFTAFDTHFGKDRRFLTRIDADKMVEDRDNVNLHKNNKDKVWVLNTAQQLSGLAKSKILHVDDAQKYRLTTQAAGYDFFQVTNGNNPEFLRDILLKTVPIDKIIEGIDKYPTDAHTKNALTNMLDYKIILLQKLDAVITQEFQKPYIANKINFYFQQALKETLEKSAGFYIEKYKKILLPSDIENIMQQIFESIRQTYALPNFDQTKTTVETSVRKNFEDYALQKEVEIEDAKELKDAIEKLDAVCKSYQKELPVVLDEDELKYADGKITNKFTGDHKITADKYNKIQDLRNTLKTQKSDAEKIVDFDKLLEKPETKKILNQIRDDATNSFYSAVNTILHPAKLLLKKIGLLETKAEKTQKEMKRIIPKRTL